MRPSDRVVRPGAVGTEETLSTHLPRGRMLVYIDDNACPVLQHALHRGAEDVNERLDIVPAQFRVLVVRRPKYVCRACETMVRAEAPARLIAGGLRTEATVAQVLVAKYGVPLYRQAQIYDRQGLDLDRSTLVEGRYSPPSCCGRCMSGCSPG